MMVSRDGLEASVAPQPFAAGEVGSDRRALAVRSVASAAGPAGDLAVEDAAAERNLLPSSRREAPEEAASPAFGMNPFRRRRGGRRARSVGADDGRGLDAFNVGSADESDAPDAPVHVVGDIKRAIRPDGEPRGPERGPAGLLHSAGEAVGEDHVGARGLAVGERLEHDIIAALGAGRAVPRAVEGDEGAAAIGRRETAFPL